MILFCHAEIKNKKKILQTTELMKTQSLTCCCKDFPTSTADTWGRGQIIQSIFDQRKHETMYTRNTSNNQENALLSG